jgi:glycine/D-amino acid oxidase-like deaminating enzyme
MLHTRKILLATNGYTSHLLPAFSDLIVPVQGQVAALIPPQALFPQKTPLAGHNSYGVLGNTSPTNSYDDYLIQRPFANNGQGGGELVFGGGRGLSRNTGVGVSDDSYIDQSTKHYLRTALNDILTLESPRVELQPTHEWSGIMGYSRDSAPWVGNVPSSLGGNENLFICAGYTGHGMPNASLSAKAAVMLLLGKELKDEELPGEFKISEERLKRAKALEDVKASWVEGERESYV